MTMDMAARAMAKQAEEKTVKQGSTKLAAADKRIFPLPNAADGALSVEGVKGKTVHNLLSENKTITHTVGTSIKYEFFNGVFKPNTVYTCFLNVTKNTGAKKPDNYGVYMDGAQSQALASDSYSFQTVNKTNQQAGTTGILMHKLTSKGTLPNNVQLSLGIHSDFGSGTQVEIKDVMLLEGDWTNKEVPPYFEGIKSVGEDTGKLSVKSTGKNLFDYSMFLGVGNISKIEPNGLRIDKSYANNFRFDWKNSPFKPGEKYTYSRKYAGDISGASGGIYALDSKSGSALPVFPITGSGFQKLTVTMPLDIGKYDRIIIYGNTSQIVDITEIQIEKAQSETTFEPYKESKIEIPLTEPLRSLPNGVSDEIKDGKIIRRVGKRVLNGDLGWGVAGEFSSDGDIFGGYVTISEKANLPTSNGKSLTADKLSAVNYGTVRKGVLFENGRMVIVGLDKSILSSPDMTGFKTWLNNNPVTLFFELATPTETPISIPAINSFTGGMVTVENNLWPSELTISYSTNVVARVITAESTLNGVLASTLTLADKELAMKSIPSLATAATLPDTVAKINQILNIWR